MALLQDGFGFLLRYLVIIVRPRFHEYVPVEPDHYLGTYRIIAILKYSAAGAWTQSQAVGTVHNLIGLIDGEYVGPAHILTVAVCYFSDQSPYQRNLGPLGLEDVISEG